MTTMRWFGTGRSARGAPGLRGFLGRRSLTLIALVVASVVQTGCQSGFSGPCGTSPCGYLRGLRERVFNRRPSGCCGPTIGAEAPMVEGAPAPIVTPAPTTVVPALPAAPVDTPTELAPIEKTPSAIPGPPSGTDSQGAKSSTGRASYEATGTRNRLGRGENVKRALVMTPEPASRSARGSALSSTSTSAAADPSESLLDNLPPVEVPRETARNEMPPAADAVAAAVPPPAKPDISSTLSTPKTEPAPQPPAEVNVTPGLRRFVVLEPKLAGGSLPTPEGLDWLAEKGYKTILDLRETRDVREVQPSFMEDVTKRGLRYVVLPIGLNSVDAEHISRFNDELSLADARPLYFCDADGTRPGVLWYIRRMTVDKIDAQAASREAEELGLTDKGFWQAASSYLESLKPTKTPAASNTPVPPAATAAPSAPAASNPPAPTPVKADATPAPAPPAKEATPKVTDASDATDSRDPTAWRSYAALMVTGLGVPLAYWSRTALPSLRMLSRASLPAPAHRPQSLPAGSGD